MIRRICSILLLLATGATGWLWIDSYRLPDSLASETPARLERLHRYWARADVDERRSLNATYSWGRDWRWKLSSRWPDGERPEIMVRTAKGDVLVRLTAYHDQWTPARPPNSGRTIGWSRLNHQKDKWYGPTVYCAVVASGWPPDPQKERWHPSHRRYSHEVNVPIGLVFATLGTIPLIAFVRGPLRRRRRRRRGLCLSCGYNLTGLPEPKCPECGTEFGVLKSVPDGEVGR